MNLSHHSHGSPTRKYQVGLQLVECLVALAIVAVLAATATPYLDGVGTSIKLTTETNNLVAGLYLARSESIKRSSRVALCKSDDGQACSTAGGWDQGWIIFHDRNNNARREVDEAIILRGEPSARDVRITGNSPLAQYISFDSTGGTRTTGGAFQAGTITFCKAGAVATQARQVIISAVGRPRTVRVSLPTC